VVDLDLASFFDEVDHDLLMARVRRKVKDNRMLKLIRAFLNSGVMAGGLTQPTDKGHAARRAPLAAAVQYPPGRPRP
jgi:retron-type reverse transcriptase